MLFPDMQKAIDLLAAKAVRRIEREAATIRSQGGMRSRIGQAVAHAIGDARAALEATTNSAVAAQTLHNEINDRLITAGIARRDGCYLLVA